MSASERPSPIAYEPALEPPTTAVTPALRPLAPEGAAVVAREEPLSWSSNAQGRRASFSPSWQRFRGRSEGEELDDGWLTGVHPEDRARVQECWLAALALREPLVLEYRLRRADGCFRTVVDTAAPAPPSAAPAASTDERPAELAPRYVGVCLDVTARRRAESAARFLSEAGALLTGNADCHATLSAVARLAVPALADACTIELADADGHLRPAALAQLNESGRARGGASEGLLRVRASLAPAPANGAPLEASPADAFVLLSRVAELSSPGEMQAGLDPSLLLALGVHSYAAAPVRVSGRAVGRIAFAALGFSHVFDEGDLRTLAAVASRIGRALELAQRLRDVRAEGRARDELLATVSHELRTPLSAIVGWAGLLRRGTLDEAGTRRALDAIERSTREQARVVEDLLDASRIASGSLRLLLRRFDLVSVVRGAIDAAREQARARNVQLEATLPTRAVPLAGDPARVRQIAAHLLANALKFTAPGGAVRVAVELEGETSQRGVEGSAVWLRVSDDGRGIRAEVLPYIFERFRQGDASTTRAHGGLGLGLALVRHLAELHGGVVQAESAGEGRGASFCVTLPVTEGASVGPLGAAGLNAPLAGVSVVVVESADDARDLLCAGLIEAGARVRVATDTESTLRAFVERAPDVVVCATPTPWPEGLATLRAVRGLDARQGGLTPSVALTDAASTDEVRTLLAAGFQVALPRPVDPRRLVAAVIDLAGRSAKSEGEPGF